MRKLIATHFTYSMLDTLGQRKTHHGSYLGRKPANRRTIVAFMNRNAKQWRPKLVELGNSYSSHWIAK